MPKVIFFTPHQDPCSFYRTTLPILHCYHDLSKNNIQLLASKEFSLKENGDTYIVSRIIKKDLFKSIYTAKCLGKKIIWTSDDDIFNVPVWNPFCNIIQDEDLFYTSETIKLADSIIVSTENLAKTLARFNKTTYVLPNLIDVSCFKPKKKNPTASKFKYKIEKPVQVLWAGSCSHDEDLKQIIEPILKLIEKYNVHFTFFGYFPTEFIEYERFPGNNYPLIRSKHEKYITFIENLPINSYFDALYEINADIGIAPLTSHPFNDSKSNLKSLEYLMSDSAFCGSPCPPYSWITQETGILTEDWYSSLSFLIENQPEREKLAQKGKEEVIRKFSWQNNKNIWTETLNTIC